MSGKRNEERDERVKLPLDPETALRALLAVDPDDEPADPADDDQGESPSPENDARARSQRNR
jgi:hypothetical protein